MSNPLRKIGNYLGLLDDLELETPKAPTTTPVGPSGDVRITPRTIRPESVVRTSTVVEVPPQLDLPVLDRIITLHPRFYNEARTIGEHYRQGKPVIMNLSDMEESERKRLVDFASGLVFGHHGSIERVTPKVFLLTPPNVSVSVEDKTSAAQASFFNQS